MLFTRCDGKFCDLKQLSMTVHCQPRLKGVCFLGMETDGNKYYFGYASFLNCKKWWNLGRAGNDSGCCSHSFSATSLLPSNFWIWCPCSFRAIAVPSQLQPRSSRYTAKLILQTSQLYSTATAVKPSIARKFGNSPKSLGFPGSIHQVGEALPVMVRWLLDQQYQSNVFIFIFDSIWLLAAIDI